MCSAALSSVLELIRERTLHSPKTTKPGCLALLVDFSFWRMLSVQRSLSRSNLVLTTWLMESGVTVAGARIILLYMTSARFSSSY